jgi:hypothetical protein
MTASQKSTAQIIALSEIGAKHADVESAIKLVELFHDLSSLHNVIDSDLPLRRKDRKLLADFIWRHTRLKWRGRPPMSRLYDPKHLAGKRLKAAVFGVRQIMKDLRSRREAYGRHEAVLAAVAKKCGISVQQLTNAMRRSSKKRT